MWRSIPGDAGVDQHRPQLGFQRRLGSAVGVSQHPPRRRARAAADGHRQLVELSRPPVQEAVDDREGGVAVEAAQRPHGGRHDGFDQSAGRRPVRDGAADGPGAADEQVDGFSTPRHLDSVQSQRAHPADSCPVPSGCRQLGRGAGNGVTAAGPRQPTVVDSMLQGAAGSGEADEPRTRADAAGFTDRLDRVHGADSGARRPRGRTRTAGRWTPSRRPPPGDDAHPHRPDRPRSTADGGSSASNSRSGHLAVDSGQRRDHDGGARHWHGESPAAGRGASLGSKMPGSTAPERPSAVDSGQHVRCRAQRAAVPSV